MSGQKQTTDRFGRAFTLVEVLVSITVLAIIFPALYFPFRTACERASYYIDCRRAVMRTILAETLLKQRLFYCGYGMPLSAESYKASFKNLDFWPFSWNGPISSTSYGGRQNAELRIAYGVPEGSALTKKFEYGPSSDTIAMPQGFSPEQLAADSYGYSRSVKSWLLFGKMQAEPAPLHLKYMSGGNLTVRNHLEEKFIIPKGDILYIFCAVRVFVKNRALYTYDFRTTGDQPRVAGVADMRFYVDSEKRSVTAYLLVMGDAEISEPQHITGASECPQELLDEWENLNVHRRLFASKIVWRLPNCAHGNYISDKNASVLY